ncbi:thiamine phosphate synthase [Roseovarius atlanticus]|uniref:thiamine phosphate synthase n=1 Tax=Roseovarius atlanticus TaxID=1641875 RepID=UPI001C989FF7|nr:thiamine phosphate synthase [Roseovarius atlanticus]MBY5988634.1 thiamine phosphate synthase [Roseovarius atlanticus]MBY6124024.1 thiamine phosphate synthase [Roseovarius atlanticus]MBY6148519.1 thiamine phosphate synthase [Roseovarius atlanticus]
MAEPEQPQIYLITPPEIELARFPQALGRVLDDHEIACVRLALSTHDEMALCRAADACREVAHARDVAIVIDTHFVLADRLGLDGVHLTDGARTVRKARKELGPDAIVGAFCATSRHEGMSAAEAGADYVSFGPAGVSALGDGSQAEPELYEWWSQMIEVPVVAEGALDKATIAHLVTMTDFFGIGEEIWREDDPSAALANLIAAGA